MMKTIDALLKAEYNTRKGHHSVEFKDGKRCFRYYHTDICIADDNKRLVTIDNGNYYTSSTTRAINDYIKYFEDANYIIVDNRN